MLSRSVCTLAIPVKHIEQTGANHSIPASIKMRGVLGNQQWGMESLSNPLPLISHNMVHVYHYNEQSRKPNSKHAYKTFQSILLFSDVCQKPRRDLEGLGVRQARINGFTPTCPTECPNIYIYIYIYIYRLPHLIHMYHCVILPSI